jgi:hypothetical protein
MKFRWRESTRIAIFGKLDGNWRSCFKDVLSCDCWLDASVPHHFGSSIGLEMTAKAIHSKQCKRRKNHSAFMAFLYNNVPTFLLYPMNHIGKLWHKFRGVCRRAWSQEGGYPWEPCKRLATPKLTMKISLPYSTPQWRVCPSLKKNWKQSYEMLLHANQMKWLCNRYKIGCWDQTK